MISKPIQLLPSRHLKVWGSTDLAPWFDANEEQIGEYWFSADGNQTSLGKTLGDLVDTYGADLVGSDVKLAESKGSSGRFPILVKFLFTTGDLSVQVHPDDEYGWKHENSPGKTEMWYVLRADPGARIALGFKETVGRAEVSKALESEAIIDLLCWVEAQPGQSYFVKAGTVHALGRGLAVCEIQQNSDVTYRLYDYGRPRELHVEKSLAVADPYPHPGASKPEKTQNGVRLATCAFFETELTHFMGDRTAMGDPSRFQLLIFTRGKGRIGGMPFQLGECWLIPASCEPYTIEASEPVEMLKTFVPPVRN